MGAVAIADASRKSQQAGRQGNEGNSAENSEHGRRGKDDECREGGCDTREDSGERGSPRNDLEGSK